MIQFQPCFSGEYLDYTVDMTQRLGGETIKAAAVSATDGGGTADSVAFNASKVTFWFSGAPAGAVVTIKLLVTTNESARIHEEIVRLTVAA